MNVLVCIPCLLTGGTEVQTLSLVEALVAAGHRVDVACYFEWAEAMAERYRAAGAEVRLLSERGERPAGLRATATFLFKGLRRAAREFRPDVAHVQYMAPGALPIVILRALGVRKIVATSHTGGDIYSAGGLRTIRFLTRHVLTSFQCITELAEKSYFGTSRMFDGAIAPHFTIYNNIPSHIKIRTRQRPPLDAAAPITVGVVSRLERIKGMDMVVPAFAWAAGRNARLQLLVVGDGSLRESMERQAAELGIADRATFAGRQPQSELQAYYDRIDILLMPSRSEGFGLTAIEGMARGCIPVVAAIGGLPEVVTPGCGLLHPAEDVNALAEDISSLSASPDRLAALSRAAIGRARNFSAEVYRNKIATLYDALR